MALQRGLERHLRVAPHSWSRGALYVHGARAMAKSTGKDVDAIGEDNEAALKVAETAAMSAAQDALGGAAAVGEAASNALPEDDAADADDGGGEEE